MATCPAEAKKAKQKTRFRRLPCSEGPCMGSRLCQPHILRQDFPLGTEWSNCSQISYFGISGFSIRTSGETLFGAFSLSLEPGHPDISTFLWTHQYLVDSLASVFYHLQWRPLTSSANNTKHHVPGVVLNTLCRWTYLNFTITLRGRCHDQSHSTGEVTEIQWRK